MSSSSISFSELKMDQDYEYEQCVLADLEKQYARHSFAELRQAMVDSWNEERRMKTARLGPEPAYDRTTVLSASFRVKMPSGNVHRLIRRFKLTDTVQAMQDYVDCLDCVPELGSAQIYKSFPVAVVEPSDQPLLEYFGGFNAVSLVVEVLWT